MNVIHGILFFTILLIVSGCIKFKEPLPTQIAQAKVVSNHVIETKSYEIPKAIFRGVLWPSETTREFRIWIISNNKELFYNIPAPSGFAGDNKDVTADWMVKVNEMSSDRIIYLAERKDGSKSLKLEIPVKKRPYSFSVLKNASGTELLLFMDISEETVDRGLFGYVVIKE